jgi:Tfp pilus assembly protein PilN
MRLANVFPYPANELAFDLLLTNDLNSEGRLAIVGAARTVDLKRINEEAQAAGISVQQVLPIALGSALIAREQGLANGAILEDGSEGISLDIVTNGDVQVSRILQARGSAALRAEVDRTFQANDLPCADVIAAGNLLFEHADRATSLSTLEALSRERLDFTLELADQAAARRKKQEGRRTRLAGLMALSAILMAGLLWDERSQAEAEVKLGEARWAGALKKDRSIRDGELTKSARLQKIDDAIKLAFEPGQSPADILAALSNATPANVWLTGLTIERGKPLSVRGTSTDSAGVKQFLERLNASDRFRDVKLSFANDAKIDDVPVNQFALASTAVGNIPLAEPDKKKSRKEPAKK